MSDTDNVHALDALTKFLKGDSNADESTYVQQIKEKFDDEKDQKAFALRLVIHYAGDISQPLHDSAEVDSKYPESDRGGNLEKIKSIDGVSNMHAVWDSVIYEYTDDNRPPLSSDQWDWFTSEADKLAKQYPVDESDIEDGKFSTWAQENLKIAKDFAYADFSDPVTDEYKAKAKPIIKERMMLGAARLYHIIVDIYGQNSVEEVSPEVFLQ